MSSRKTILLIADDIFFSSKIQATAERLGTKIIKVRKQEELYEKTEGEDFWFVIIDLASKKFDATEVFTEMKKRTAHSRLLWIGYLPHVEKELAKRFLQKGVDLVVPRSIFSRKMDSMLRKIIESPIGAQ